MNPEERDGRLRPLLAHELAHIWLEGAPIRTKDHANRWFHEAIADFVALQFLRKTSQTAKKFLQERVTSCRTVTGSMFADRTFGRTRAETYGCGLLFMLVTDMLIRDHGYGEGLLGFYRETLQSVVRKERNDHAPFFDILNDKLRSNALYEKLLRTRMEENWGVFLSALEHLGLGAIEVEQSDPLLIADKWLMPLVTSVCSGPSGYWWKTELIELDMPADRCTLSGPRRTVEEVNGIKFLHAPLKAYKEVERTCARGGRLVLSGPGAEPDLVISCSFDVQPLLSDLRLIEVTHPETSIDE